MLEIVLNVIGLVSKNVYKFTIFRTVQDGVSCGKRKTGVAVRTEAEGRKRSQVLEQLFTSSKI